MTSLSDDELTSLKRVISAEPSMTERPLVSETGYCLAPASERTGSAWMGTVEQQSSYKKHFDDGKLRLNVVPAKF